ITTEAALFNHFVKFGIFEGRACCEGFNVAAYKSSYSDLQAAFGDDIVAYYVHYVTFGQTEKRALVTVEAAAAAGVTVKSAADGTVVAAGAAKPAAGGAASSSGSAASTENKANNGSGSSAGVASVVKNTVGVQTTSKLAPRKQEVNFAAGIDYDYSSGVFYNYNNPTVATAPGVKYKEGYVDADSDTGYASLESVWDVVGRVNYKNLWWDAYIDWRDGVAIEGHMDPTYDKNVWYYDDSLGGYLLKAQGAQAYYSVSGGKREWNFKKGTNGAALYTTWDKAEEDGAVFRSVAAVNNAIKKVPSDYLRMSTDTAGVNTYYSRYHKVPQNVASTLMEDGFFATAGGALTLDQALLTKLTGGVNWYFTKVEAKAGYVLGEKKNEYGKNDAGQMTSVKAYTKVDSYADACDLTSTWTEYKGMVVKCNPTTKEPIVYSDVENPIAKSGWWVDTKPGTTERKAYPIINMEEVLKREGYKLYKSGGQLTYTYPVTNGYVTAKTPSWSCFRKEGVEANEACSNTAAVADPSSNTVKYYNNTWDSTYYKIVTDLTAIFNFADDTKYDGLKQFEGNGRFYVVE
ncbi:MAG: hypothetical protein K5921_08155, partial [Lachnospiraceae bacterium]|nr:hypothetical protein [Lachnospiraceae bacterium]